MKSIFYLSIFVSVLFSSCTKDDDLVNFNLGLIEVFPLNIIEFQENIYVKLSYEHPQGYLGFSDPDYLSLEVKDSRLSQADYYHLIPITPPNNNLSVSGELLVEIDSPFLFGNGNTELVNFSLKIQDQNLTWSNTITTPNISVNRE